VFHTVCLFGLSALDYLVVPATTVIFPCITSVRW